MVEIYLAAIIILLFIVVIFLFKKLQQSEEKLGKIMFAKQSQSVKYGKLTEQFLPFTSEFPFDPQSFRFIGSPIDGIAFDENKIIFLEFKTLSSKLSEKQKRIKELVQRKRVEWFEINIK